MARHLPPEEMLLEYAAGTLPEPLALLVASHLTLAPESRREVLVLEDVGGAMLEDLEPAELSSGALDAMLARLDEEDRGGDGGEVCAANASARTAVTAGKPRPYRARESGIILPAPLRAYIDCDSDRLPWRERSSTVAEYEVLPGYPDFRTRLLRIRAGAKVPSHTHEGREYTLVLDGSFSDEGGRFERGDVEVADGEVTHTPVAGRERDCFCLAVTDAPLRLTGPFGRFLNYFVDL